MDLFNLIINDLQEVATWQTKIHNKLIDIRSKLKNNGWERVIIWDSEYYISPDFYTYLESNNLSVYNESEFYNANETDKWYGHIVYIGEV